jgi:two-component system NtrC family sensor kinase/two-component system sensor histidine kinase AtoS
MAGLKRGACRYAMPHVSMERRSLLSSLVNFTPCCSITLLNSLSAKEKELFKQGLEDLINQTYVIEDEYKKLGESYTALQDFIRQIIEVQPNALWVFDNDGAIFLQNSEAKKIGSILEGLSLEEESEVDFEGRSYLIKSVTKSDKKIITATDITEGKRKNF